MAQTHEEVDRRSLALHARVAARLRAQPSLIRIAHHNLDRWRSQCDHDDPAATAIREWKDLLESLSLDDLCDYLVRQDESAARLRQNSPFAGILSPAEVWEIKQRYISENTPT